MYYNSFTWKEKRFAIVLVYFISMYIGDANGCISMCIVYVKGPFGNRNSEIRMQKYSIHLGAFTIVIVVFKRRCRFCRLFICLFIYA